MKEDSIPVLQEPRDTLRVGLGTLKSENEIKHPIQKEQSENLIRDDANNKAMLARMFGSHLPARITMEQSILSQFRRFPGLRSSLVGLETLMGLDTEIEFDDFLDDPDFADRDRRGGASTDLLARMEERLGEKPLPKFQ